MEVVWLSDSQSLWYIAQGEIWFVLHAVCLFLMHDAENGQELWTDMTTPSKQTHTHKTLHASKHLIST